MEKHRHKYVVTRYQARTNHPFVKECSCGKIMRFHRTRWIVTQKGKGG